VQESLKVSVKLGYKPHISPPIEFIKLGRTENNNKRKTNTHRVHDKNAAGKVMHDATNFRG